MLSFACVTGRSELIKFRQGPTAIREIRAFPRSFVHTNERLKFWGVDKNLRAAKFEQERTRKQKGVSCSHKRAFHRPIASVSTTFLVEFLTRDAIDDT